MTVCLKNAFRIHTVSTLLVAIISRHNDRRRRCTRQSHLTSQVVLVLLPRAFTLAIANKRLMAGPNRPMPMVLPNNSINNTIGELP